MTHSPYLQITREAYKQAWSALGDWIQDCVNKGQGAVIPNLGQITLVEDAKGGKRTYQANFQVSSAFGQKYRCRPATASPSSSNVCKLNPTALATQHAMDRSRLKDSLKQIIQEVGHSVASRKKVLPCTARVTILEEFVCCVSGSPELRPQVRSQLMIAEEYMFQCQHTLS
jgi:hypothetical protein